MVSSMAGNLETGLPIVCFSVIKITENISAISIFPNMITYIVFLSLILRCISKLDFMCQVCICVIKLKKKTEKFVSILGTDKTLGSLSNFPQVSQVSTVDQK